MLHTRVASAMVIPRQLRLKSCHSLLNDVENFPLDSAKRSAKEKSIIASENGEVGEAYGTGWKIPEREKHVRMSHEWSLLVNKHERERKYLQLNYSLFEWSEKSQRKALSRHFQFSFLFRVTACASDLLRISSSLTRINVMRIGLN